MSAEAIAALVLATGVLVALGYHFVLRRRVDGLNRQRGDRELLAEELGSARLAALSRGEVDARCLAAHIVALAEKGALCIEDEDTVLRLRPTGSLGGLDSDERMVLTALFPRGRPLVVQASSGHYFAEAIAALIATLDPCATKLFVGQRRLVFGSFVLGAAFLVTSLALAGLGMASAVSAFFGTALVAFPWASAVLKLGRRPAGGGRDLRRFVLPLIVATAVPALAILYLPSQYGPLGLGWLLLTLVNLHMKHTFWRTRTAAGELMAAAALQRATRLLEATRPASPHLRDAIALGVPFAAAKVPWYGPGPWSVSAADALVARLSSSLPDETATLLASGTITPKPG